MMTDERRNYLRRFSDECDNSYHALLLREAMNEVDHLRAALGEWQSLARDFVGDEWPLGNHLRQWMTERRERLQAVGAALESAPLPQRLKSPSHEAEAVARLVDELQRLRAVVEALPNPMTQEEYEALRDAVVPLIKQHIYAGRYQQATDLSCVIDRTYIIKDALATAHKLAGK